MGAKKKKKKNVREPATRGKDRQNADKQEKVIDVCFILKKIGWLWL